MGYSYTQIIEGLFISCISLSVSSQSFLSWLVNPQLISLNGFIWLLLSGCRAGAWTGAPLAFLGYQHYALVLFDTGMVFSYGFLATGYLSVLSYTGIRIIY